MGNNEDSLDFNNELNLCETQRDYFILYVKKLTEELNSIKFDKVFEVIEWKRNVFCSFFELIDSFCTQEIIEVINNYENK